MADRSLIEEVLIEVLLQKLNRNFTLTHFLF